MKIAALYDIHGNLPALEAVLAEVQAAQVDAIVIGGDALSGPMPLETLDRIQELNNAYFIHGNGESDIVSYLKTGKSNGLTENANKAAESIAKQLSAEQADFIASWQLNVTLNVNGLGDVLFCHATPHSDTFIFTCDTPEEELTPLFSDLKISTVICGHTHMQFERKIANTRVLNAGSVGMPFAKQGAFWLLLDEGVTFKDTNYNLELAAERIRQSGYPEADSFINNNLLSVPSEQQALAMMAKLAANQVA